MVQFWTYSVILSEKNCNEFIQFRKINDSYYYGSFFLNTISFSSRINQIDHFKGILCNSVHGGSIRHPFQMIFLSFLISYVNTHSEMIIISSKTEQIDRCFIFCIYVFVLCYPNLSFCLVIRFGEMQLIKSHVRNWLFYNVSERSKQIELNWNQTISCVL